MRSGTLGQSVLSQLKEATVFIYVVAAAFLVLVAMTWRAKRSRSQHASRLWAGSIVVGLAGIAQASLKLVDRNQKGLPFEAAQILVPLIAYVAGFVTLAVLKRADPSSSQSPRN
jgi:uncharacterized membrane protein